MATISITFLGAVISFIITLVMAEWALGYLEMRVPFDVEIRNNYSHSFISEANISNANELPALLIGYFFPFSVVSTDRAPK